MTSPKARYAISVQVDDEAPFHMETKYAGWNNLLTSDTFRAFAIYNAKSVAIIDLKDDDVVALSRDGRKLKILKSVKGHHPGGHVVPWISAMRMG